MTGGESVTVTDVLLVDASGSNFVNGSVKSVGGTDYLVSLNRIPEGAFGLRLKGRLNNSSSRFQRQSSNHRKGSRISVKVMLKTWTAVKGTICTILTFQVSKTSITVLYMLLTCISFSKGPNTEHYNAWSSFQFQLYSVY